MSIIPNSASAPATAQDIKVNNPEPSIPSIVISDGKMMKTQMKEVNLIPFKKKRSIKKNKSKFIWLGKDCWSGNMNTHQTHRLHVTPQRVFFGNWTLAFLICSWNEPY